MKIVINKCYGGFSISLKAAEFMAKRGNKIAKTEIADYKKRKRNAEKDYPEQFYGYGYVKGYDGYSRHDPDLVAAVEQLGSEKASGRVAKLEIVDIPDGVNYTIEEYDGQEWIAETHRTWS